MVVLVSPVDIIPYQEIKRPPHPISLNPFLGLPNITVSSYFEKEEFIILQINLLHEKVKCFSCDFETDDIHQNRPILIRDLSICGHKVYLQVPRRQIYCPHCQKYSTEILNFVEKRRNFTKRYEEYIYERVKELTVTQVSVNEKLTAEQVKTIFTS